MKIIPIVLYAITSIGLILQFFGFIHQNLIVLVLPAILASFLISATLGIIVTFLALIFIAI